MVGAVDVQLVVTIFKRCCRLPWATSVELIGRSIWWLSTTLDLDGHFVRNWIYQVRILGHVRAFRVAEIPSCCLGLVGPDDIAAGGMVSRCSQGKVPNR